jgi:hypothetical protein
VNFVMASESERERERGREKRKEKRERERCDGRGLGWVVRCVPRDVSPGPGLRTGEGRATENISFCVEISNEGRGDGAGRLTDGFWAGE